MGAYLSTQTEQVQIKETEIKETEQPVKAREFISHNEILENIKALSVKVGYTPGQLQPFIDSHEFVITTACGSISYLIGDKSFISIEVARFTYATLAKVAEHIKTLSSADCWEIQLLNTKDEIIDAYNGHTSTNATLRTTMTDLTTQQLADMLLVTPTIKLGMFGGLACKKWYTITANGRHGKPECVSNCLSVNEFPHSDYQIGRVLLDMWGFSYYDDLAGTHTEFTFNK